MVSGGAAGRGAGVEAAGAAALLHHGQPRRGRREERGQREAAERLRGLAVVATPAQAAARPLLIRRVHGVVVGAAGAGAAAAAVAALVAAQAPQAEEPPAPKAPAAGGGGQGGCQGSLAARRRHGAQSHRQVQGALRRVAEVEAVLLQRGLQAAGRAAAPAVQRRVALGGLGSGSTKTQFSARRWAVGKRLYLIGFGVTLGCENKPPLQKGGKLPLTLFFATEGSYKPTNAYKELAMQPAMGISFWARRRKDFDILS